MVSKSRKRFIVKLLLIAAFFAITSCLQYFLIKEFFNPNLDIFAPYFSKCPSCHDSLAEGSFESQWFIYIPLSYMLAYHVMPLIFTVKKHLKGKLRSRKELFSPKIGGARLVIYIMFSLPIYFSNNISNAILSLWIGPNTSYVGYAKNYSGYFIFALTYFITVFISV